MSARSSTNDRRADIWLKRLLWLGIADFLLISAFEIHHHRIESWRLFDAGFADLAAAVFNQPSMGWWLYAIAFPFVAVNFGSMVLMLRGRRGLLIPFLISMVAIAFMQFAAGQTVRYHDVWSDVLWMAGYFIGGMITAILFFNLDGQPRGDISPADA
ncbi:MAG: hypothetical protein CMN74_05865 [Sphingorhabdus sp.]|nr:hypothetical protein [Sphingorhabdus sp.]